MRIDEALNTLKKIVSESGNQNDLTYFNYHQTRFKKMAETVTSICPPGARVLDIGSHFLHSSVLLSLLGYQVVSMDVKEFWDLPYVKERARQFNLTAVVENNLEQLNVLSDEKAVYDLILFTEIFEHITFNPINFWKKIHILVKDKGTVYITTPNALTLYAIAKTAFNLLRFRGIGIDINAIFKTVTYGHHWKEYAAGEIRTYFNIMSDGFLVKIRKFYYKTPENIHNFKSRIRGILMRAGNLIPFFRDALEVVVTVDKSKPWKIDAPEY